MVRTLVLRRINEGFPLRSRRREDAFAITNSVHLGRASKPKWYVEEREKPDMFEDLETLICMLPANDLVSRNHAGIIRAGQQFRLYDLNSYNGTTLQRGGRTERLGEGNFKILRAGDVIGFGPVQFDVSIDDITNYALLVGSGEDNPGAAENDINALGNLLERRGYENGVFKMGQDTSKRALLNKIIELAAISQRDSHFIFYYHGHGGNEGLTFGRDDVSPEEFYRHIAAFAGKKAVILESCRSGRFLDRSYVPGSTLVITASSRNRNADEVQTEHGFRGRLCLALCDYLESHPHRTDLVGFGYELRQQNDNHYNIFEQRPGMASGSFTCHSIVLRD